MKRFLAGLVGLGLLGAGGSASGADRAPTAVFTAASGAIVRNGLPKPKLVPDDVIWFLYPVTLRETSGRTGLKVLAYQKCYEGDAVFRRFCGDRRTDIARLYGSDTIPPGGRLELRRPAWVWSEPTGRKIKVIVTYYAEDDNGHPLQANYSFDFVAK